MPTYAYRCTVCSDEFDAKQSFSDDALTVCPECGGALRKLFSPVGVVFKGSGFYRTDSRPSATSTALAAPKESAPAAGASAGSSTSSGSRTSAGSTSSSSTSSSSSRSSAKATAG
ncbi:FmdB family zinc ribbon protein [Georgenia sp.]